MQKNMCNAGSPEQYWCASVGHRNECKLQENAPFIDWRLVLKVTGSEACSMNVLLVHIYRDSSAIIWDTMYRRRGTVWRSSIWEQLKKVDEVLEVESHFNAIEGPWCLNLWKEEENEGIKGWWKSLKQVTDIAFELNSHVEITSNILSVKSRLKLKKVIVFIPVFFFSFRTNKWFVIRDRKRQFWEAKLPEFPAQPFKRRRIKNGDLRLV